MVERMSSRAPAMPAEERRCSIIAAALPLFLEQGATVTSRQIAEAAGVAEGTVFAVFRDKQAIVRAAVEAALDPEPTERALSAIDRSLPFEEQLVAAVGIIQQRTTNIWRLVSSVGDGGAKPSSPPDFPALVGLFEGGSCQIRTDPAMAAHHLRALTLATSHPVLSGGHEMSPRAIVSLLLDGIRVRERCELHKGA
jgi:AcrR family transcriptional regulator